MTRFWWVDDFLLMASKLKNVTATCFSNNIIWQAFLFFLFNFWCCIDKKWLQWWQNTRKHKHIQTCPNVKHTCTHTYTHQNETYIHTYTYTHGAPCTHNISPSYTHIHTHTHLNDTHSYTPIHTHICTHTNPRLVIVFPISKLKSQSSQICYSSYDYQ